MAFTRNCDVLFYLKIIRQMLASLGTEGFYAWKVYEIDNTCNGTIEVTDVCIYDELQVRSYIGLGEGIFATCVSVILLIGFASPSVALIWIWVVWALGIASYNAYCIKDYYDVIMSDGSGTAEFPWDVLVDLDYGLFFIVVMTSVIWYGAVLLLVIPMGAFLTHGFMNGDIDGLSFDLADMADQDNDNEGFVMDNMGNS